METKKCGFALCTKDAGNKKYCYSCRMALARCSLQEMGARTSKDLQAYERCIHNIFDLARTWNPNNIDNKSSNQELCLSETEILSIFKPMVCFFIP